MLKATETGSSAPKAQQATQRKIRLSPEISEELGMLAALLYPATSPKRATQQK
jgi:hypothetical protein